MARLWLRKQDLCDIVRRHFDSVGLITEKPEDYKINEYSGLIVYPFNYNSIIAEALGFGFNGRDGKFLIGTIKKITKKRKEEVPYVTISNIFLPRRLKRKYSGVIIANEEDLKYLPNLDPNGREFIKKPLNSSADFIYSVFEIFYLSLRGLLDEGYSSLALASRWDNFP